jgi:hypothetical protein
VSESRPLRSRAIDGAANFGGQSLAQYATPGVGLLGNLANRAGVVVPALDAIAEGAPPLAARLYADQWIVTCDRCGSASYCWPDAPLFLCAECFNGTDGGLWRRVTVPDRDTRQEIEAITGMRPLPAQRNWLPGETVDDLRRENGEHGHPVPPEREGR